MAFKASVVPFQLSAGAGGTLDITEAGFGTPSGALFFLSGSENASGITESDALISVGITDGNLHYVSQIFTNNGTSPIEASRVMLTGAVISESDAFSLEGRMTFNSWITDGVRLDYQTAFDKEYRGYSVLLGDPAETKFLVECIELPMTSDNKDFSLIKDFKPELVIFVSTAGDSNGISSDSQLSIGWACRTGVNDDILQGSVTQFIEDNVGNVVTAMSSTTSAISELLSGAGSQTQMFVDEWRTDGFGITRIGTATNYTIQAIAIGLPTGTQALLGTGIALTSPGNRSILTPYPSGVQNSQLALFLQTAQTGLGFTTTSNAESLSIGMVDSSGNQAVCSWRENDGSDTALGVSAFVDSGVIHRYEGVAVAQRAKVTNIDSPDLDIDFLDVDAAPDMFHWFALQSTPLSTTPVTGTFKTSVEYISELSSTSRIPVGLIINNDILSTKLTPMEALQDLSQDLKIPTSLQGGSETSFDKSIPIESLQSPSFSFTIPVAFSGMEVFTFTQSMPVEIMGSPSFSPRLPVEIRGLTTFITNTKKIPVEILGGSDDAVGVLKSIPVEFTAPPVDRSCVKCFTQFNGVTEYGQTLLSSHLEQNLKVFMDWSFLGIGAWTNINIPTSGAYGGDFSDLRLVDDPSYTLGQVWEAARQDWVYETGIEYTAGTPNVLTGIFINGVSYATGDSTFGHHYNYGLGRVIFDSAITTTSVVELNYSYRNVHVQRADTSPWWDELQYDSLRPDNLHFSATSSGTWSILANHRVQLPSVILEIVPRRDFEPYQLGDLTQWINQDVLFHVVSQSKWERNQLLDIISFQNDKTIWLFDSNLIAADTGFPLDFRGMLLPNPNMYPHFVQTGSKYQWLKCQFTNTNISEVRTLNSRLHKGSVRTTLRVLWHDLCD